MGQEGACERRAKRDLPVKISRLKMSHPGSGPRREGSVTLVLSTKRECVLSASLAHSLTASRVIPLLATH